MSTAYHLRIKGYTDLQQDVPSTAVKPFTSLGSAIEAILDMIEYQSDDIAEVLICNDIGNAVYSIRPTGNRQFHLKELF